ncbi:MAG: hypothetical protein KGS72_08450 [Cyanobacteria bacterium REEB67]|nr:hypothetical protein [Cyanobacteria bacterium REEB67]
MNRQNAIVTMATLMGFVAGSAAYAQANNQPDNKTTHVDLTVDANNYKEIAKNGLHLFPGEIVEFKVDAHLNYQGATVHPALEEMSIGKRTLYRARTNGQAGTIIVERGMVIPFYGLWAISAAGRDHALDVKVDSKNKQDNDNDRLVEKEVMPTN